MTYRIAGLLAGNPMYQEYQIDSLTKQPIFQPERNQLLRNKYFSRSWGPELFMVAVYILEDRIQFVSKRLYVASKKNAEKLSIEAASAFENSIAIHSNQYHQQLEQQKMDGIVYRYQLNGTYKYLSSSYLLRFDLMEEMAECLGGDLLLSFPSPGLVLLTKNIGEVQSDFAQLAERYKRKDPYGEWGSKNLFVFRKEKRALYRIFYDRVVSEP